MEAIILLGHGSRAPGAVDDMERIAAGLKRRKAAPFVEVAHMSMCPPGIAEVFQHAVSAGATRVLVLPYFLHLGVHLQADIPRILQEIRQPYPGVEVVLGKHLGFDERLADILAARVKESEALPDIGTIAIPEEFDEAEQAHGRK